MIRIINFETFGSKEEGFLTVAQQYQEVPFNIRRIFWVVDTPTQVSRGGHAHIDTEMILIALRGSIKITTLDCSGEEQTFDLQQSNQGLYLPKMIWHEMTYSPDAVQLVLASSDYQESDYIRNYSTFQSQINK